MKKAILLVIASLALIVGSRWAFTSGAAYELREFPTAERMHVLDTTMIGEKWMLAGGVMGALAIALLMVAAVLYFHSRRRALD
jgi:hypothetical protein